MSDDVADSGLSEAADSPKPSPAEGVNLEPDTPESKEISSGAPPGTPVVVGMGASAGGLDASKRFFGAMPSSTGLAFVLVQHLDPTHESLMADLLGRYTDMPVIQVEDEMPVEPDHVYIIPPDRYLVINAGILRLSKPTERRGMRMPIDFFLVSLAEDMRERAIGIILSGTASDGTLGIKAVKAQGGVTLVQDPKTAQYDGMPRNAMATGMVDYVLPVEQMPDALVRYIQHFYVNGATKAAAEADRAPDHLESIARIILEQTRHDLRNYKKSTVIRRIERRMGIQQVQEMSQYVHLLMQNPTEVTALFKDLLINITNFFREPDAFAVLQEAAITDLVRSGSPQRPIRVWAPGCSTGEEPYSVAMLLTEQLEKENRARNIQVFATDIDEEALETARAGIYPAAIAADITPERLQRFFVKQDDCYQVHKSLREAVVFAPQNLIADPPFSKMDLVVCRNLLIYLEPQVQDKVITLLHFALNSGGYLFLGNSETLGMRQDLFQQVSKKWRIYRRIAPLHRTNVEFPIFAPELKRERPPAAPSVRAPSLEDILHQFLIEAYAPAAVLVNRNSDVVYLHGTIHDFLRVPPGQPTRDLLAMVPDEWRVKIRAAMHRASRMGKKSSVSGLLRDGAAGAVRVTVTPLGPETSDPLLVVAFESVRERRLKEPTDMSADESMASQLENELRMTREDLQNTIEQLETSNEELKASNEEVMSMNEELQSTNEELETSKEELQSLNEELGTVNNQLQEKVQELEAANTDLANVLASTDVATLFLDRSFRIKRFTPAITSLLRLIPSDTGRELIDIVRNFDDPDLLDDASRVLRDSMPLEREVPSGPRWYLRRILPYRSLENEVEGVVITFAEVTALKAASREFEARARQRQVVANLGRLALGKIALQDLMQQAVENLATVVEADYASVMELQPDHSFLLRAGTGWDRQYVGTAILGAGDDSLAGHALESNQTLVVEDVRGQTRFRIGPLLRNHTVASSVRVIIRTIDKPFGVLGVDTIRPRTFSSDDIACLQEAAGVLAQALDRRQFEQRLEALNRSLEKRVAERTAYVRILMNAAVIANEAPSLEQALHDVIAQTCAGLGCSMGHVYLRQDGSNQFADAGIWTLPDSPQFQALASTRRQRTYRPGEGIIGEAISTKSPIHVPDLVQAGDLLELGAGGLVKAACAVPVMAGGEVVAVLEFLGSERASADDELLAVLAQLGAQIGRVADRRQTELRIQHLNQDLQRRVSEFETLMNVMPAAIAVASDAACREIRVNQTFADMLGVPTNLNTSASGSNKDTLPFRFLHDGHEIPSSELPQQICGREGKPLAGVELDLASSGRLFHLLGNVEPLYDEGGHVRGSVAAYLDVTERRLAEEERRQFEERMMQTQKLESLGVLAGGIAHDFNNLLTSIMGNADLARRGLPSHSPTHRFLDELVEASAQLAGLTRQMLAYAGKGQFLLKSVRLTEVIEDMQGLLTMSVSKNCALRYELGDRMAIHADVVQIRQVAMNLVINASEAISGEPGVVLVKTGEIRSSREDPAQSYLGEKLPEGDYSYLEVRDTGSGMAPDVLAKVFDPFFTTKFTGRGLGLAAVMGVTRSHNGAIQLASSVGQGTMFRVLFPVSSVAPEAIAPRTENQDRRGSGSVLVVDDEDHVRRITPPDGGSGRLRRDRRKGWRRSHRPAPPARRQSARHHPRPDHAQPDCGRDLRQAGRHLRVDTRHRLQRLYRAGTDQSLCESPGGRLHPEALPGC